MTYRPLPLNEMLPHDTFVGVSLVVPKSDRFLFGIREPKQLGDQLILEITGIGGGCEAGDNTPEDAARREAQEEICSEINLYDSPVTLVVHNQNIITPVGMSGAIRPAAIVYRNYRTPPHQPWFREHQGETCLVIFLATICDAPQPCGELPWLIWLTANQILDAAQNDILLSNLLNTGASLVTRDSQLPPKNALTRLTDSQEALALALGDETPNFYEIASKLVGF